MTVRIAHGFLLTPAPWLRARNQAASDAAELAEPVRAWVIRPQEEPVLIEQAVRALLPASSVSAPPQAARAAQAYAAASDSLRAWATGCCVRVRA